jgi:hypothetical protein
MWREEDWPWCKDPRHAAGPMWMDGRHVEAVYQIASALGPQEVIELGCFDGFASSAIVQAKLETRVGLLTCVDREIRDALIKTVRQARDGWILWQGDSADALGVLDTPDMVILDTDHDLATTQREWDALDGWKDFVLIAHDVGSAGKQPGPIWLLNELINDPDWYVLVDELPREGEATHRGLMVATTEEHVYRQISRVWPDGRVPAGADRSAR